MYNTISEDLIAEALNTSGANIKETKTKEPAPKGGYTMAVKGIYARQTSTGTPAARVLLVHTGDNTDYANAYLDFYKSKEDINQNSSVTNKALVVIADAAGFSGADLQNLDFTVSGDSAAITVNGEELALSGKAAPAVFVYASLDVETFTDRNGNARTKSVVKSIGKLRSQS